MGTLKEIKARKPCPGRSVADRYVLQHRLGRGGFGEVWIAADTHRKRSVALKLLSGYAPDTPAVVRFQQEFSLLAGLAHPHLNPVYDFGRDAVLGYFFTAAVVQGESMAKATATASVATIEVLAVQALRALAHIHSRGIAHFDIKPGNMLVEGHDAARLTLKLIDFGLASLHPGTEMVGTPSYMAPEFFLQEPADGRADLYALGVVLYTCLTRTKPFAALDFDDAKRQHLHVHPAPPSTVRAEIPSYLDTFVLRLLAKTPAARYANAAHALRELCAMSPLDHRVEADDTAMAYVPDGHFLVGREAQQAQIQRWLACQASIPALIVEGEDGMGKTSLLHEIKTQAQLREVPVLALWGPEDPAIDAFTASLAQRMASVDGQPTVVLIDDYDRLMVEGPMPALATLCTEMWDAQRATTMATNMRLCCGGSAVAPLMPPHVSYETVHVLPLQSADIATYLQAIAPIPASQCNDLARQLFMRSRGSPALLKYMLRQLVQQGQLVDAGGLWDMSQFEDISLDVEGIDLPRALTCQVETMLAALPSAQRRLLEGLTVYDAPCDLPTWYAVCGVEAVQTHLGALRADGWIHRTSDASSYALADPRVAGTLRAEMPDAAAAQWHARIVLALRQHGAPDEAINVHLAYSDMPDAHAAFVRLCAHEVATGKVTVAIRRLTARLAGHQGSPHHEALLALLARYYVQTDQYDAGHRTIAQLLTRVRPKSPEQLETLELCVAMHLRQRRWDDAAAVLASARTAAAEDPVWLLRFANAEAKRHMLQGETARALARYEETWDAAMALPQAAQGQIVNNERSQCHWLLGDAAAAMTCARAELALLPEAASLQVAIRRYVLARALHQSEQRDAAQPEYAMAIAAARQAQDLRLLATLYNGLGILLMEGSAPAEAIPLFERAIPLCYRIGDLGTAVGVRINLAHCFARCDQTDRADQHLRTALVTIDSDKLAHLATAPWQCTIYQLLGDCARRRQRWAEAVQSLAQAWALAKQHDLQDRRFGILFTRGELARDQERWNEARRLFGEADTYPRIEAEDKEYRRVLASLEEPCHARK